MPLFDDMYFDQKWSMWDSWIYSIGRKLRVAAMTTQHRLVNVITAQNRLVNFITAQYRKIGLHIGG